MADHPQIADERPDLSGLQRRSLIVGGVGAALLVIGALLDLDQFFRAYLMGWILWVGVAVGGLALAALHQLTGGTWGMVTRRIFEASARTIPYLALLFIPIAFGMHAIYEWTHADVVAGDALLEHKQPWLNVPFFLVRTALYLGVWTLLAYFLSRRSVALDHAGDAEDERRVRQFSAIGLLLTVLTVTFAGYDWIMSLEPHWFSSIFGAIVGMGMIVATFTFTILVVSALSNRAPFAGLVTPQIFNDLGSLLLAFTMVWAYLHLSQLVIIWSANIPEEVEWYIHRSEHGWTLVSVALVLFHFVLPFVLLLARTVRANRRHISRLAAFLFVMQYVELVWLVRPSLHAEGHPPHWMDFVAPIAIGGIWLALFVRQLRDPLIPLPAIPRLRQRAAEQHGHHHHQSHEAAEGHAT